MRITGGTDVRAAPPLDYFRHVLLPLTSGMGVRAKIDVLRRGYYPRGGGEVIVEVKPSSSLQPLVLIHREFWPASRFLRTLPICPTTFPSAWRIPHWQNSHLFPL